MQGRLRLPRRTPSNLLQAGMRLTGASSKDHIGKALVLVVACCMPVCQHLCTSSCSREGSRAGLLQGGLQRRDGVRYIRVAAAA